MRKLFIQPKKSNVWIKYVYFVNFISSFVFLFDLRHQGNRSLSSEFFLLTLLGMLFLFPSRFEWTFFNYLRLFLPVLVLAQRMFEMHSLWNDAQCEKCERLRENALLPCVGLELKNFAVEIWRFSRHYPQPKPTVVVDNPEMQRMRLLTDIQSNVRRHSSNEWMRHDVHFRRNIMKILIRVKENLPLWPMIQL